MLDTNHRPWPHRLDASGRAAVAALVDGSDCCRPTWSSPIWYRAFRIYFARNPVFPLDYAFCHGDHDGDDDDPRHGAGRDLTDCMDQIDAMLAEGLA